MSFYGNKRREACLCVMAVVLVSAHAATFKDLFEENSKFNFVQISGLKWYTHGKDPCQVLKKHGNGKYTKVGNAYEHKSSGHVFTMSYDSGELVFTEPANPKFTTLRIPDTGSYDLEKWNSRILMWCVSASTKDLDRKDGPTIDFCLTANMPKTLHDKLRKVNNEKEGRELLQDGKEYFKYSNYDDLIKEMRNCDPSSSESSPDCPDMNSETRKWRWCIFWVMLCVGAALVLVAIVRRLTLAKPDDLSKDEDKKPIAIIVVEEDQPRRYRSPSCDNEQDEQA